MNGMMKEMTMKKILATVFLLIMAPLAEAHTGLVQNGFMSGLSHPLLGLDHLLAMLGVGLWAGRAGGKARWWLPLTFIAVMFISAIVAQGMATLPLIENGIAVSLLLIGLFIVFAIKIPMIAGIAIVSLFAVFHGAAHGMEWPLAVSPYSYVSGFVITTAVLHIVGVLTGGARFEKADLTVRLAGMLTSIIGGGLLLAN